jgi:hypothetical protein
MNPETELVSVLQRTFRVIPSFTILSIGGCALAHYAFGVPAAQLGVVVAVPLLGIFAISRVLRIVVTPTESSPERRLPQFVLYLSLVTFCSGILTIDFLLSAPIFSRLALSSEIVRGTLAVAAACGLIALISLMIAVIVVMRKVMGRFSDALKAGIWRILMCPTRLADRFQHLHDS